MIGGLTFENLYQDKAEKAEAAAEKLKDEKEKKSLDDE